MGTGFAKPDKNKTEKDEIPTPRSTQWKQLQREDKEKWGERLFDAALNGENIEKNRYQSVLAPDGSRVKLSKSDGLGSDYINANFVDGVHAGAKQAYIATQAPKPETIEDFWRMCWEQNVCVLIMLTNLEEGGKVKAHQYWPKAGSKQYGMWTVALLSNTASEDQAYVLRTLELKMGTTGGLKIPSKNTENSTEKVEKRIILQFHYQIWPDMGVPEDATSLLQMMDEINSTQKRLQEAENKEGPLLVHCSGKNEVKGIVPRKFP